MIHIYPTLPLGQDMTQGEFFKRSLAGLNSEFSFSLTSCLTKAEEPSLPYYLPIAGGRIIGFIPFQRVLVLCEMQTVLSRNWTRIAVSILLLCDRLGLCVWQSLPRAADGDFVAGQFSVPFYLTALDSYILRIASVAGNTKVHTAIGFNTVCVKI